MLQICITKVSPTTRVGVTTYKDLIRAAKLSGYGYDIGQMTDKMTANYDEIVRRGSTHDGMVIDLFKALKSGKNDIFTSFIQRKCDLWEQGANITPDELITEAVMKYNSMIQDKT